MFSMAFAALVGMAFCDRNAALIEKVGKDVFVERLDSFFTVSRKDIFRDAGRPSPTRKWTRLILDEFYGSDGIHGYGYGQDEDQGQLGAWYEMGSMGLFDVAGLTGKEPSFAIGSPVFDKITIKLNPDYYPGGKFEIVTKNNSKENIHIESAELSGKPFEAHRIPFKTIAEGGQLTLNMTSTPTENL